MHTSIVMGSLRIGGPCRRKLGGAADAAAEAEDPDPDEEADAVCTAEGEGHSSPENISGTVGLEEDSEADNGTSMSSRTR